jgi:hypothetical protein
VLGKAWSEIVASTGKRGGKAKYGPHPRVTEDKIQEIEMSTVSGQGTELSRPKDHVRAFWRKLDEIIGASKGQETRYVYVEYHLNGAVHGYPITEDELKAKGM